jgi:hypothetical protein
MSAFAVAAALEVANYKSEGEMGDDNAISTTEGTKKTLS